MKGLAHNDNNGMITIDVSSAVHARAGLGRYAQSLAVALHQLHPKRFDLFYNQGQDGKMPASLAHMPARHINWGYKPWRMAVWLANLANVGFNRLLPATTQLFHSTEHLLFPTRAIPTVLTMHDLIFKLFPAYHKPLNYHFLNRAVPIFCQKATAIIAVSEATKRDVVTHYGIDPAKIHVVYEAPADHFRPPSPAQMAAVRRDYGLPDQYLLHLSTIEPRKNLTRLVEALKIVRRDRPQLKLLLAGAKGWLMDDFFAQIEADGLTDVVLPLGWVPDEALPAIIAQAQFAVQPSLYEGFGLPILEHMACGQAVAASHASSHPEVGGDAAIYFDPQNVAEMATAIRQLLNNPDELAYQRALGLEQAGKFSWGKAARQTMGVYESLL